MLQGSPITEPTFCHQLSPPGRQSPSMAWKAASLDLGEPVGVPSTGPGLTPTLSELRPRWSPARLALGDPPMTPLLSWLPGNRREGSKQRARDRERAAGRGCQGPACPQPSAPRTRRAPSAASAVGPKAHLPPCLAWGHVWRLAERLAERGLLLALCSATTPDGAQGIRWDGMDARLEPAGPRPARSRLCCFVSWGRAPPGVLAPGSAQWPPMPPPVAPGAGRERGVPGRDMGPHCSRPLPSPSTLLEARCWGGSRPTGSLGGRVWHCTPPHPFSG